MGVPTAGSFGIIVCFCYCVILCHLKGCTVRRWPPNECCAAVIVLCWLSCLAGLAGFHVYLFLLCWNVCWDAGFCLFVRHVVFRTNVTLDTDIDISSTKTCNLAGPVPSLWHHGGAWEHPIWISVELMCLRDPISKKCRHHSLTMVFLPCWFPGHVFL